MTPAPGTPDRALRILKARRDFLAAARAGRAHTPGFVLQARNREDEGGPRVGFTCSKKVGDAVARNRAKRRLRELARLHLRDQALPGWDYVLIGRAGATASHGFAAMAADLAAAVAKLHRTTA